MPKKAQTKSDKEIEGELLAMQPTKPKRGVYWLQSLETRHYMRIMHRLHNAGKLQGIGKERLLEKLRAIGYNGDNPSTVDNFLRRALPDDPEAERPAENQANGRRTRPVGTS